MLRDHVATIVTPGETIDVLVTDFGIAVNPLREDILASLKGKGLPLYSIEELKAKAEVLSGIPEETEPNENICGLVEYRDGTIIDIIRGI